MLSPQWRITVPFLVPAIFKTEYAPVMELVDMRDLGSRAAMRVGSSPFRRTKIKGHPYGCPFRFEFCSKRLHGAKAQFPANPILILTPCAMPRVLCQSKL